MPAVAYAPADHGPSADGRVAAGHIRIAEHKGGCGQEHEIGVNEEGRPYIECESCAPVAVGSLHGWAATPHGVALTPDEIASRELATRDAQASQNSLINAMVHEYVSGQHGARKAAAPAGPSLADASPDELVAALPDDLRRTLLAALERALPEDAQAAGDEEKPAAKPRTPRAKA